MPRRRISAEEERRIAVEMRKAEARAREIIEAIPELREILVGPEQRTVAGHIDRLELAVETLWRVSTGNPQLRRKARSARRAWNLATAKRWELAMSGERIAIGEARKIGGGILTFEELCQEGRIGLLRAAKRFDPERGLRFSTYARWWVRAQLTRQIDYTGRPMRLPNAASEQRRRLVQQIRQRERAGEPWTVAEMAQDLRIPEDRVRVLVGTLDEFVSLDESLPGDGSPGNARRIDMLEDQGEGVEENIARQLRDRWARWLLQQLPERHRQVLRQLYGIDGGDERTLAAVGREFGVSKERIRQLREQAFEALRGFEERDVAEGEASSVPRGTPVAAIKKAIGEGHHTGRAITEALHGAVTSSKVKAVRLQLRALTTAGLIERHGQASATRYTLPGDAPPPVKLNRRNR